MKRIIVIFIILIPLISCFEDRDTSRLELNLGTPDPSITKIHIGVYDTNIEQESLLEKYEFPPDTNVNINITSGQNRIIVVWAETTTGKAEYYGVSAPFDTESGNSSKVFIDMKDFATLSGFAIQGNFFVWTKNGADYYDIYQSYSDPKVGGMPTISIFGPLNQEFYDYGGTIPTSNYIRILRSYSEAFNLRAQSGL